MIQAEPSHDPQNPGPLADEVPPPPPLLEMRPPPIIPFVPPNHYRDANSKRPELDDMMDYTTTYSNFQQEFKFEKVLQTQPPRIINPALVDNLRSMNRSIGQLMVGILRAYGDPVKSEKEGAEIAEMVNDIKTASHCFMEACRDLRINEAYRRLIDKRKQDISETNALSDRISVVLDELDRKFSIVPKPPKKASEDESA